ncbi:MAG: hypothetical protein FWD61_15165 [Phycisphaerales bacterium]|nr:hypothetical protein [Phycisphaerales bacterium]
MSNPGNMNFLPEDYVEKRQATKTAIIFIGLLLVVVGGIVGAWLYTLWKNKPIFDENTRVNAQYEDASKKIAEFQAMDRERAKMVAKAEITTTLMERVRRFTLLEELTRLRPKGVNFVEITLKSSPVSAPCLTEIEKAKLVQSGLPADSQSVQHYDVTVDLIATAPTDGEVAQYIAALNKDPILTDVNLEFSQEYKKTSDDTGKEKAGKENARKEVLRKFYVTMKINPTADLRSVAAGPHVEEPITKK